MNKISKQLKKYRRPLLTLAFLVIPAAIIAYAIMSVNEVDSVEVATSNWSESGHADFNSISFTYWDDNDPPLVPANCAACHSSHGLLDFIGERGTEAGSVSEAMPIGTVVSCVACHTNTAHQMESVAFPSSAVVDAMPGEGTCLICHQGRNSTVSLNNAIDDTGDDEIGEGLSFMNPHYHVAAATLMGTTAQGGYEYADHMYVGRFEHTQDFQSCTSCHDAHSLRIDPLVCSTCHVNVTSFEDLRDIREDSTDYDGDGDTSKGIAYEIDHFQELLYEAILAYADEVVGTPIIYYPGGFPYFYVDPGSDDADAGYFNFGNRYTEWTPRLLRAAYNYQFVKKDPGAYSHNPQYALQILYDSLADMSEQVSVDIDGLTRP